MDSWPRPLLQGSPLVLGLVASSTTTGTRGLVHYRFTIGVKPAIDAFACKSLIEGYR